MWPFSQSIAWPSKRRQEEVPETRKVEDALLPDSRREKENHVREARIVHRPSRKRPLIDFREAVLNRENGHRGMEMTILAILISLNLILMGSCEKKMVVLVFNTEWLLFYRTSLLPRDRFFSQ